MQYEPAANSDIDLVIVGKPEHAELATEIRKAQKTLRREINYTALAPKELKRRLQKRNPFVTDIWSGKRIELVNEVSLIE